MQGGLVILITMFQLGIQIYDALDILDSIINYEPSDAELEAYNDSYSRPTSCGKSKNVRNEK